MEGVEMVFGFRVNVIILFNVFVLTYNEHLFLFSSFVTQFFLSLVLYPTECFSFGECFSLFHQISIFFSLSFVSFFYRWYLFFAVTLLSVSYGVTPNLELNIT